jgi:DNA-directed RNA polymerase subunit RPC12/RpoP
MNSLFHSLEPRCSNCGRKGALTYVDGRALCNSCVRINFECDSRRIVKENFNYEKPQKGKK